MYGHLSSMCEGCLVWMLPFSPLFWPQLPITTSAACYENPWLIDGSSQLLISCTLANTCPYINCKPSLCRWPTFWSHWGRCPVCVFTVSCQIDNFFSLTLVCLLLRWPPFADVQVSLAAVLFKNLDIMKMMMTAIRFWKCLSLLQTTNMWIK